MSDRPPQPSPDLSESETRWRREVLEPFLDRHPERRERFTTPGGVELPVTYPASPPGDWPGEFPFTRGIHPTMHRGRPWPLEEVRTLSSICVTARDCDGLKLVTPDDGPIRPEEVFKPA